MKILIGYDGSESGDAALENLRRSGLPRNAEALVVSVAEVWLPPLNEGEIIDFANDSYLQAGMKKRYETNSKVVEAAVLTAKQAGERLRISFPDWKIQTEGADGSPTWEILARAKTFGGDLIVVGSHGRSALGRFILGSISQKVLTEAECSVRIGRGNVVTDDSPSRLIVGFDGSPGAEAAIEALVERAFGKDCEVRLITATNPLILTDGGLMFTPVSDSVWEGEEKHRQLVERLAEDALAKLKKAGFKATFQLHTGNPKQILLDEAEEWNADAIFIGANAFGSRLDRLLLGSVSAAIAARAHCTVEVVRRKKI